MLATESSQPGGARKMLKPLVEKRRRDRINKNLEELRLLLLQKTHCQTLKNPKVEKAEILELAVRYLQERQKAAEAQGANPSEDGGLQTCYATGFRVCFGHLASFVRRSPRPSRGTCGRRWACISPPRRNRQPRIGPRPLFLPVLPPRSRPPGPPRVSPPFAAEENFGMLRGGFLQHRTGGEPAEGPPSPPKGDTGQKRPPADPLWRPWP